ncbi:hypothetical protein PZN02_002168 [Sinorhizobium garamanticum]|uniref:Glucose uptake protein n=1 Tax=Sinorhizobium garamanticum TaxID=680247 RepID=A0ABY8D4Z3_9HYPH|nr:hypothetical protein [Sinorhizobium garamanticum]MCA1444380.1 hypothetical protein [Ensifer sp. IC4062]WEX85926.1 hypothetical protein PZN02_002168 [Sinorhizobium garamanticum]
MNPAYVLWLLLATFIFLGGATASRAYVSSNSIPVLLLALGLYVIGNLIMVKLMREGGLGLAISLSAVVQLVLVNLIAFTLFGEKLSTTQMAGVLLGIAAMGLMLLPTSGRA